MPKLYIMCGLPGAGKSTFTKSRPDLNVVNLDSIREELFGDEAIQRNPRRVFSIACERVNMFLRSGQDVIFDGTNVTRRRRRNLMKIFPNNDYVCVWIATELSECLRRNQIRPRHVPDEVIANYARKFVEPTLDEGFCEILKINA